MRSGNKITGSKSILVILTIILANACFAQEITSYSTKANTPYLQVDNVASGVVDKAGNMYFVDAVHSTIYKASIDGNLQVVAGKGHTGYSADGSVATNAYLNQPIGLAIGNDDCLYFAEYQNNCVRKITKEGIILTVAGTARSGYGGNGGKAINAQLSGPTGVAFDKAGNLYVSEADNNCVRKVDMVSGIISLYAGNALGNGTGRGTYSGDGGKAIAAGLNQPGALTFDNAGNLYIVDCFNHCIRKVTAAGIISTIAGTGEAGFNGDSGIGREMKLNYPNSITCDNLGNIYVSDYGNNKIRMIATGGVLTTFAGTGQPNYSGDGGLAIYAGIGKPTFVAADANSKLYIGDKANRRIRVVNRQKPAQVAEQNSTVGSGKALTVGASSTSVLGMQ